MEECVDNIREAMGLESTHYLVLPDDVAEMKKAHDEMKIEIDKLRLALSHARNCW